VIRPPRIGIIAAARFPVVEPFAGGLEAHVWGLADRLRTRGHEVTLFAGAGSDPRLGIELLDLRRPRLSDAARRDVSMTAPEWVDEHHAYLALMLRLGRSAATDFDVIHNHSLHYLPVAMAATVPAPMVCTLHTPPTPWLESAIQAGDRCPAHFVAVSEYTARAWSHIVPDARIIRNGVDVDRWCPGPGGGPPVWFGRIAPEKGAHLAIDAAVLAGTGLLLAGPVSDRAYFETEVRPRIGHHGIEYAGHLTHAELVRFLGAASAALVTPCWDEPYGLVVAEALACGTPVCGFARGALPELLDADCGRLVDPGDVPALAAALGPACRLSRVAARRRALSTCSLDAMVDGYVELYETLTPAPVT
jgi:glycosyltransferase involved in cell wall biosynthesis